MTSTRPDAPARMPVEQPEDAGHDLACRVKRVAPALGWALGIGLAAFALHLRDPHYHGSWGECPSLTLFGIACPLCGGLRAVNDLTNRQINRAFYSNPLVVVGLPMAVLWWVCVIRDRWLGTAREWAWPLRLRGVMPAIVYGLLAFTLFRNVGPGRVFYPGR